MLVGAVLLALGSLMSASAQTTGLIGGGLTALPPGSLGPNQLQNAGFETTNGTLPVAWSKGRGWVVDHVVKRSGTSSFRATGDFDSATQNVALKKGIYKLSGWIRTQGIGSGDTRGVRLQFDRRPVAAEWQQTDLITGTRDWTLFEVPNIVVTTDAVVTVRLENFNSTAGTVWFDDLKLEEQKAQGVEVFMLYPNFRGMLFDDQSQTMKFDVTVTPPGDDFEGYSVRGVLKDEASGQQLRSQDYAAAAGFVADLDGSVMQPGRAYLVTFSLVNRSDNTVVSTYPAYRVSKVPASARTSMNVSFDAKNRVLVHGVPRFVLGVYDSGMSYNNTDAFWENLLWSPTGERRMDGMKINFYLNYWYGGAPAYAMKSLMDNLAKHNVMYLQTGNCHEALAAGSDFRISSDAYVSDIGAHPANAGYYTVDECFTPLIPGAFAQYDRLRRLDPDSMTFLTNFAQPNLVLWRDSADILSTDPYPLYHIEPSGGYHHGQVGEFTVVAREAVKDARPIMTVLQFFKFTDRGRFPTLPEMRNHAWMAIVEGARGLFWWNLGVNGLRDVCSGWCAQKTVYMNNLKTVVNEVAALEPVLLADDAPGALTGNSNSGTIRTKVKLVGGRGYLFAYNTTKTAASTTFTWNTAPGSVTVNAEDRTLAASGKSFTDSFGPYQAHVYVIDNGGTNVPGGGSSGPNPGTNSGSGSPTVRFVNPAEAATVKDTMTVTLAGAGGTGSGYTYILAVNGSGVYTGTNPTFGLNTRNFPNGEYTLTARVKDGAGRTGQAIRTITVSNTFGGLTVALTAPTNDATVRGTHHAIVFVSGAGSGNKTYTLTADGQTVATMNTTATRAVTIPWNTRSVADGSRVLTILVRDAAGKWDSKSATVIVDNGPPPPPSTEGDLAVSVTDPRTGETVRGTHHAIVWVKGTGVGAKTYTLSIGGQTVGTMQTGSTGPVTIPWNTRSVADGSHALTATVRDAEGKTGNKSVTVTVSNGTVTPDPPTPPTGNIEVSVTDPTDRETVRGTHLAVVWVKGAAVGAKAYTLSVGSQSVATFTTGSSGPVTIPWDTRRVANGSRALTATVRDAAGKTGSKSVTVTVSNGTVTTNPPTPPTGSLAVSVTDPTDRETVRGTHLAVVWVKGAAGGAKTYTLNVGSQRVATFTTGSSGPVTIPWDTRSVANGSRALTATVRDAAGKTGSKSVTVTVSNSTVTTNSPTPPTGSLAVSVTDPTDREAVRGTHLAVVWVKGAAGGPKSYTLSVGSQMVATFTTASTGPVTIPWDTRSVANGNSALTATVRDAAGKTGSRSVPVAVSNGSTTAPPAGTLDVSVTAPLSGRIVKGDTAVIAWVEGTTGGSNTFTLKVDGVVVGVHTISRRGPVTFPWDTRSKANGNRTLTVSVRDATGRTGSVTTTVVVRN
jgi:hypothetical protein